MIITNKLKGLFLFLCVIALSGKTYAQDAPVTTVQTVGEVNPGLVEVVVTVDDFSDIRAISLSLDYDYSVIQFVQSVPNNQLPGFISGDQDLGTGYHRLSMGWFGNGASLPDGETIMTLSFNYTGGISPLTWFDSGPTCEYVDINYVVLNDIPTEDFYINGYVCGVIGTPGTISGQNSVCQGQEEVSYSIDQVINATEYLWSVPPGAEIMTGQGTNSITVSYAETSSSGIVEVTPMNFCSAGTPSQLEVTVNILPIANAGNDTTINYGTSTILHALPGGPGSYLYHWEPEELLVDPEVQYPETVILTSTTLFSVTVTDQATLCQESDDIVVSITGGPLSTNPLGVPGMLCQGGSAQLFANAGGGSGTYAYAWSCIPPGNPPWSSILPNPVVSPDSSTQYLLSVNDGFTTVEGSTNITVNQIPTASISGGDTLCGENALTTLTVDLTGVPPWSFTYSFGNTSVTVTDQQTTPYLITTGTQGDYIITSVEDEFCEGETYGVAIVRKFAIPARPEITVIGMELISSSIFGNQWYLNDTPIPGATNQTYNALISGMYYTIVTLNTCSSEPSDTVDIIVGTTEYSIGDFLFYPNPATSSIALQFPHSVNGILMAEIRTSDGSLVRKFSFSSGLSSRVLDISGLKPGMYFLCITGNSLRSVKKMIVQ